MGIKGIEKLPAIQWELANIRKVGAKKCGELLEKLKRTLGLSGWRTREMPNLGDEPRQEG